MSNQLFFEAISHDELGKAQQFLDDGADINFVSAMEITALHNAVIKGRYNAVKFLIEFGAKIDTIDPESGFTPLHSACQEGSLEIVKLLVNSGANVNAKDHAGNGPLWRAGNKYEIGEFLMDNGADPKMENNYGNSPFNSDSIAYEYIKDPTKKDTGVRTTDLIEAIINKDITSIALMTVSGGLKLEETDENGKTALFIAAETGYEQVILLLIKQGANVNAKANDGTSILDASDKAGFSNISKTLKANGAE